MQFGRWLSNQQRLDFLEVETSILATRGSGERSIHQGVRAISSRAIGFKICKGELLEDDFAGIFEELPSGVVVGAGNAPEADAAELLVDRDRLILGGATFTTLWEVK